MFYPGHNLNVTRSGGGKTPVGGYRSGSAQPNEAVQLLQAQVKELSAHLEGLEKERDFYFEKVSFCAPFTPSSSCRSPARPVLVLPRSSYFLLIVDFRRTFYYLPHISVLPSFPATSLFGFGDTSISVKLFFCIYLNTRSLFLRFLLYPLLPTYFSWLTNSSFRN